MPFFIDVNATLAACDKRTCSRTLLFINVLDIVKAACIISIRRVKK